jgi:hypothetical protein
VAGRAEDARRNQKHLNNNMAKGKSRDVSSTFRLSVYVCLRSPGSVVGRIVPFVAKIEEPPRQLHNQAGLRMQDIGSRIEMINNIIGWYVSMLM